MSNSKFSDSLLEFVQEPSAFFKQLGIVERIFRNLEASEVSSIGFP